MFHIMTSSSPVGSGIFSALALLVISLIVLLILRHYLPLRSTPAFCLVPIFFALWLPSIVVILVPIDLASSAATDDEATKGIWLPQRLILVSWRIIYWLTFGLTWFILPILAEYSDSGYREPKDKLMYSLRGNIRFMAMCCGAGVVGLVYVFYSYGISLLSLKGLVMALAYCWGLILAIYLMGHGLVSIPRGLIRDASISGRLRRLQTKAPRVYEQMEDALAALEDVETQVSDLSRRKTGSASGYLDWIEELQDMAKIPESQARPVPRLISTDTRTLPTVITEKYLADLTRKFCRARHTRSRYLDEWHRLVQDASDTQAILDSAASKKLEFGDGSDLSSSGSGFRVLSPYSRYIMYYHILPYAQIALGGFLAAASVCIVWSELFRVEFFSNLSIIRLTVMNHWVGDKAQVGFAGQVISAFWICYMCAAALTSMTEVKVWRGRALVKRNTAYESAFWYALQVAKLSIPLSYNFMTFLTKNVYEKTAFYDFLGKLIDLTPLGRWFDDLFPVLVLFPVLATLFGLYGRVKRIFVGWDIVEDDEGNITGYGTGNWREGRDLIERELGGNAVSRRRDEVFARLAAATDQQGRSRAPVLSIPSARGNNASPAQSPARAPGTSRRIGQSSRPRYTDEPAEDENIFQIIGHRMKNTVDNIETPSWIQDIGQGIKKPKWMGGDDDQRQGDGQQSNSDFRRWFGGDGQVRL